MKVVFHLLMVSLIFVSCQERQIIKAINQSDYLELIDSVDLDIDYAENQLYYPYTFSVDTLNYLVIYRGVRANNIPQQLDIYSENGVFHKKIVLDTLKKIYGEDKFPMPKIIDFNSPSEFFILNECTCINLMVMVT